MVVLGGGQEQQYVAANGDVRVIGAPNEEGGGIVTWKSGLEVWARGPERAAFNLHNHGSKLHHHQKERKVVT